MCIWVLILFSHIVSFLMDVNVVKNELPSFIRGELCKCFNISPRDRCFCSVFSHSRTIDLLRRQVAAAIQTAGIHFSSISFTRKAAVLRTKSSNGALSFNSPINPINQSRILSLSVLRRQLSFLLFVSFLSPSLFL